MRLGAVGSALGALALVAGLGASGAAGDAPRSGVQAHSSAATIGVSVTLNVNRKQRLITGRLVEHSSSWPSNWYDLGYYRWSCIGRDGNAGFNVLKIKSRKKLKPYQRKGHPRTVSKGSFYDGETSGRWVNFGGYGRWSGVGDPFNGFLPYRLKFKPKEWKKLKGVRVFAERDAFNYSSNIRCGAARTGAKRL